MQLVTLIVPTFNESKRWNHEYWHQLLAVENLNLIFVNDGSVDETMRILEGLPFPERYKALEMPQNVGKAEALRFGFNHYFATKSPVNQELVGYLDADSACSLHDVLRVIRIAREKCFQDKFANQATEHSIKAVWGSRVALSGREIKRRRFRHYVGRLIANTLDLRIKELPYDTQCGLKIFVASDNLEIATKRVFQTRWFIDIEILLRLREMELYTPWEEPLENWVDISGSHLNFIEAIRVLKELLIVFRLSPSHKKDNLRH
jgi:dolichyl-phosphate beta-glucosyltransferase